MIDTVKMQARIDALLRMTVANGCTPAEAEAALAKANELMAKYGIHRNAEDANRTQHRSGFRSSWGFDDFWADVERSARRRAEEATRRREEKQAKAKAERDTKRARAKAWGGEKSKSDIVIEMLLREGGVLRSEILAAVDGWKVDIMQLARRRNIHVDAYKMGRDTRYYGRQI